MEPDIINAIGMILMAVFTIVTILFFRTKPIQDIFWLMKVPMAIGGIVFTFFIFILNAERCVEIPEPFGQFEITALSLACLIIIVDRYKIMIAGCLLILIAGVGLYKQFNELVRYSDIYTTINANTHKPMPKWCSVKNSRADFIAENLWHTWFTGIYKIKK
jgi:hypothetical protein